MAKYKTLNLDIEIHKKINEIVNNKRFLYRDSSEFVHETLRLRLIELQKVELLEKAQNKENNEGEKG